MSGRYPRKHTSKLSVTSIPNKLLSFRIQALEKYPLIFISSYKIVELIEQIVVVEFVGDERHDSVDSIILGGNIVDGCIAYEYGEDETYDGCEYLTNVGAGLPFLKV